MTSPGQRRPKPKHPPLVTLRALREAYGLSREDLAQRIAEQGYGLPSVATIGTIENCHEWASNELITAWAKALRLNPTDVILPPGRSERGNGEAA